MVGFGNSLIGRARRQRRARDPAGAGSACEGSEGSGSPVADHFSTTNLPSTTFSITPVSFV